MQTDFTFDEMRRSLVRGWGDVGARTAECWLEFNATYFGGDLPPLPIFFTRVAPYGKCAAWTRNGGKITHIALCWPRKISVAVTWKMAPASDRGMLLHEMIHQALSERGVAPDHKSHGWRAEIARIHRLVTGEAIVVADERVIKVKDEDGTWRSRRIAGEGGRRQGDIARWPHSYGVDLGPL